MTRAGARRRPGADARTEGTPHVVFRAGGEEYALPLLAVREVARLGGLERPPGASAALAGVMDLRGEPVAVLDLAVAFGGPSAGVAPESCALIVEACLDGSIATVGLAADAASRVAEISSEDLSAVPRLAAFADAEFVAALGHDLGRIVPILDLDRLLGREEVRAALRAARTAAAEPRRPGAPL